MPPPSPQNTHCVINQCSHMAVSQAQIEDKWSMAQQQQILVFNGQCFDTSADASTLVSRFLRACIRIVFFFWLHAFELNRANSVYNWSCTCLILLQSFRGINDGAEISVLNTMAAQPQEVPITAQQYPMVGADGNIKDGEFCK